MLVIFPLNKFIQIVIVIFVIGITGCSTAPKNNNDFGKITKISNLNGTYLNKGDTGNKTKIYLSRIIWGNDKSLNHKLIGSITVKALDSNQLQVRAIQNQSTIKEQIFIKNKDFNVNSAGHIKLRNKASLVNDIAVGVEYQNIVLGIDTLGNGKYVNNGSFVGTVLIAIPLIFHATEHVRFLKIK